MAVRRALVLAVFVLALGATASSAFGAVSKLPAREKNALGLIPTFNQPDIAAGTVTPVVYHGGPVMKGGGGVTIHTIFWQPSGFTFHAGYRALIEQFFTDAAHDNGTATNIFSTLPQFADTGGPGAYDFNYNSGTDSITATDSFPPTDQQCASANGIPTCLTDHQIQNEVDSVIEAGGLPRGLDNLYMVYLPQDVDTCIAPGICGTNAFGGYHSLSDVGHGTTIYANLPDPAIEGTLPDTATFPEGNPDAEIQIDVSAHEAEEAVTDPLGTAWMDPNGFEVADKCEFGPVHGPALGQASNGADFNQEIGAIPDKYLLQEMWSNNDNGCVQRTSDNSSPLPLSQVSMDQFSSTVSGNIGSNNQDDVTVDLFRGSGPDPVAETTVQSSATDGSWSADLSPEHVGDDRDIIVISYSGPGAPAEQTILTGNGGAPNLEAGWTGWGDLDTGYFMFNNSGDHVAVAPCFQTGVFTLKVAASPVPMGVCDTESDISVTDTAITAGQSVTLSTNDNRAFGISNGFGTPDNPNGGLVDLTVPLGEVDGAPNDNNFLGGFPLCSADLEGGTVSCSGLVPALHYTLTRSRGSSVVGANADGNGDLTAAFSGSPALAGGDTVSLRNGASRVLTTLHVAHLRVDLTGENSTVTSGHCEPNKYYGPFTPSPSESTAAGVLDGVGPAGSGVVCPSNGNAAGLSATDIEQTDDASAGQTATHVPVVEDTSPMQGETLYGAFTALADPTLGGAASNDQVSLSIAPAAGGSPVFTSGNTNTASGVAVPALTPGAYKATWVLTDKNGDTRTVTTRFIEQAANAGPQGPPGPPGPPGPRGPRGPRGFAAKVTCHVTHHKIKCTVKVKKTKHAAVRAILSRGSRIAAVGHGKLSHGKASLTLRPVGRLRRGKARITLVLTSGRRSVTTISLAVRVR